jgi:rod shape-determining protein MreC
LAFSRRIGRSRFTLILLVLTSITLLTLDFRGFGPIDAVRSRALSVFSPVGDATAGLFKPVGNLWHGALQYDDLKRQNDELQAQVDELNGQITSGDVAKQSLQQLLEQAHLPFVGDLPTARARVVSGSVANFDDTIEIDKGSNDGIKVNMPVVVGTGLVGSVVRVADDRSVIKLITDPSFNVGISVVGSTVNSAPVQGSAHGQGSGRPLRASLDAGAPVRPGQILVTAGVTGGRFPADLPVGTVASVSDDQGTLQTSLDIEPLANLNDLTYVSVVLWPTSS